MSPESLIPAQAETFAALSTKWRKYCGLPLCATSATEEHLHEIETLIFQAFYPYMGSGKRPRSQSLGQAWDWVRSPQAPKVAPFYPVVLAAWRLLNPICGDESDFKDQTRYITLIQEPRQTIVHPRHYSSSITWLQAAAAARVKWYLQQSAQQAKH